MLYLLILVNSIYLGLELFFNISLLDVASSSSKFSDIHHLELLGRALSSFGFTFIFWKIISVHKKISIKKKITLISIITVLIYPSFYYGQTILINYLSNSASSDLKKNSYALVLVKEGIRSGNFNLGIKPYSPLTIDSSESKTFGVLNGIILLHNDTSLNFIKSNLAQLSYSIFSSKARKEAPLNYEKTKNIIKKETDNLWTQYTDTRQEIASHFNNSIVLMSNNYTKINGDVKSLWASYSRNSEKFRHGLHDYYGHSLEEDLTQITKCQDADCFNRVIEHNKKTVQSRLTGQGSKSSTFRMEPDIFFGRLNMRDDVYDIGKICSFQETGNRAIYVIKDSGEIKNYTFNLKGDFIKGIYCNINHDEMKKDYIAANQASIISNMHTYDFEHKNINSFLNDKMIQDFLDSKSTEKGGVPLPRPFPLDNSSDFKNQLITNKQKIISNELSDAIQKRMKINISGNLQNRDEFRKSSEFKKILQSKLSDFYFDGLDEDISKDDFNLKFTENLSEKTTKTFMENYQNSDKYNIDGNSQVKLIIVPPIALSLSLFFTLVNGGILILSILKLFIKNEHLYNKVRIIMIFFILTLIVSPIKHENSFSKDEAYNVMLTKLKKENLVLGYCIDWTMKTEPMIISMIEKFK